jgi:hypothetical protein
MAHLFTLDVRTMPELAKRVGADVVCVSVFCWHPDHNEAWEADTDQTGVVFTTAAQLATPATLPEDVELRDPAWFEVVAIDVPPSVWAEKSDLRQQIYQCHGRVLGEPLWLQDEQDGGDFLMQFDESFCSMNLGDAGIMYVFEDAAFWQCH